MANFKIILFLVLYGCNSQVRQEKKLSAGQLLAEGHCVNCHPASYEEGISSLRDVRKYRTNDWLYKFIKNPVQMIQTDSAAKELAERNKPVVMTSFPLLENEDIDAILDFYDSIPVKLIEQ